MNTPQHFVPFSEVKILAPCPLRPKDMNDLGNDCYHCDSCDKKVFDFTNATEEEFNQILIKNDYNICGIFDAELVEQDHQKIHRRRRLQSLFLAASFLLFCLVSAPVYAQQNDQQPKPNKEVKRRTVNPDLIHAPVTPAKGDDKPNADVPPKEEMPKGPKVEGPTKKELKKYKRRRRPLFRRRRIGGCPTF